MSSNRIGTTNDLKTKIADAAWAAALAGKGTINAEQIAQAALQAIHDAGYDLLPREPTPKVSTAIMVAAGHVAQIHNGEVYIRGDAGEYIYAAMIAAQPKTEKT